MPPDTAISGIAHVIQLAIAPVFLLTGIASLLGVLTNRLARIIDRARALEGVILDVTGEHKRVIGDDIFTLGKRADHVHRAIALFTGSALLVCLLIAILFLSALFQRDITQFVASLFVLVMVGVIAGLVSFLREIQIAMQSLRIGAQRSRAP